MWPACWPSGAFDTGFLNNLTGPNGTVWAVLSQTPAAGLTNGDIMIVGDFSQVNQVNSPNIARLNLNGSLDTSFNPGAGADGTVYAITQMLVPCRIDQSGQCALLRHRRHFRQLQWKSCQRRGARDSFGIV
jgi:hypothetical protein